MDYLKNYLLLIGKALERQSIGEFEKHHILPKSLKDIQLAKDLLLYPFGDIKINKKVKLTLREHFLAHLLLVKIFEKIDKNCYHKMAFAASMLNSRCGNSKKYEWFKRIFSKSNSEFPIGKPSRAKNKKWSEEAKLNKSKNHYMKGKTYEEAYGKELADRMKEERRMLRQDKKYEEIFGKEKGEKIKENMSNRVFSEEHRKNISLSMKGRKLSEERMKKMRKFFGNDLLNPKVDQTLYEFINKKTNEIIYARRTDMRKKYGCTDIHKAIRNKLKSSKGWMFTGNFIKKEDE